MGGEQAVPEGAEDDVGDDGGRGMGREVTAFARPVEQLGESPLPGCRNVVVPLSRVGTSTDVARAIAYLVEADYVTSSILPVDGGLTVA